MIFLDYVLRTSVYLLKENGFTLKRQEAETITDADYEDDITESPLHNLEQAVGVNCLQVNANKTENMCFQRERAISTLNSCPLKPVDTFSNIGSGISST